MTIGIANISAADNRNIAFGLTLDGHEKQSELIYKLIVALNKRNIFPDAWLINEYFENMLITSIRRALSNLLNTDKRIIAHGTRQHRINGRTVPCTTYKAIEYQTSMFK